MCNSEAFHSRLNFIETLLLVEKWAQQSMGTAALNMEIPYFLFLRTLFQEVRNIELMLIILGISHHVEEQLKILI